MPTVKITAFSKAKLPSPILLMTWKDEWSQGGGVWTGPTTDSHHDNVVTFDVAGRTQPQVETTVEPTIDDYNNTHVGNDAITAVVT